MASIVENLTSFNRKERFYLIGAALGNPEFILEQGFRNQLTAAMGVTIPPDAFVAMDYHLDWIYAAIFLSAHDSSKPPFARPSNLITGNQEDVDLLIAFEETRVTHLIFLEAKGVMYFSNRQLTSKAARLKGIFEAVDDKTLNIKPHFAIVSPNEPAGLDISAWPTWMKPSGAPMWLELSHLKVKVNAKELQRIVRCDATGKDSEHGDYWKLVNEKRNSTVHSDERS